MRKTKVGFAVLLTMVFLTSIAMMATPVFSEGTSPTSIFMNKLEPELLAALQESPNSVYRVVVVLNDGVGKDAVRSLLLSLGGEINAEHNVINAISVSIPGDKLQSVTSLGDVSKILIDGKKFLSPIPKDESSPDGWVEPGYYYSPFPFWHEADKAWDMGIDGSGVTVAILDTGVFYEHPDLTGVVLDYEVFTSEADVFPHDGYGHGTACAGLVASQGIETYYGFIKVLGVAPGAKIIGGKVLTDAGWGWDSWIIQGIEWAVWRGADIISCSFGGLEIPNDGNDPTALALDAAAEVGVTSFCSAGNSRGFGTSGSPSCAKDVITVGASTENEWPLEWLGYWPSEYMNGSVLYENDQLIFWSSGGSTADGRVDPDVCAIGAWGLTLDTYDLYLWLQFGGTSMACPIAAGVGALVIQAYRDAHGISPAPAEIKNILMNTAEDIDYPANRQGAGVVNAEEAVLASQCDRCYSNTGEIHTGILRPGKKHISHLKFKENIDCAYAERLELIDVFETTVSVPYNETFLYFVVPEGAEYAEVKLKCDPELVYGAPIKDYDGSQWTDLHINPVLYKVNYVDMDGEDGLAEEWTMVNYAYAHINVQWLDARVSPGDYVLWLWNDYELVEELDVQIKFYKSVPWNWISTHISGKNLKVKVKVPWGTDPGSYEGFVRVSCDGDLINIPVVATVPAKTCESFTVTANVVMEPRDSMSGDWIFIPVKVRRCKYITLTVSWFTPDADFDVYLIAPDGEVEALSEAPAADEPASVGGGGGREWYTTTGTTMEVLSAYTMQSGYWLIGIRAVHFGNTFDQLVFVKLNYGKAICTPDRLTSKAGYPKNFMVKNKIDGELNVETMIITHRCEFFSEEYTGEVFSFGLDSGYDGWLIAVTPDILCLSVEVEGDADLSITLYDPAGANRGWAGEGRRFGIYDPTVGYWTAIIAIHEPGSSEYTFTISGLRYKQFEGVWLTPDEFTLDPLGTQMLTLNSLPTTHGKGYIIYYDLETGSIFSETWIYVNRYYMCWCWW